MSRCPWPAFIPCRGEVKGAGPGGVIGGPICGSLRYYFLHSSVCLKCFAIKVLLEARDLRHLEIPLAPPILTPDRNSGCLKISVHLLLYVKKIPFLGSLASPILSSLAGVVGVLVFPSPPSLLLPSSPLGCITARGRGLVSRRGRCGPTSRAPVIFWLGILRVFPPSLSPGRI